MASVKRPECRSLRWFRLRSLRFPSPLLLPTGQRAVKLFL